MSAVAARPRRSRRLPRIPGAVAVSVVVLAVVAIAAALSPWLAGPATQQSVLDANLAPGTDGHLLGTDALGRDVLLMTVAGTASAVVGPVCVALGSLLLGLLLGGTAGYRRGLFDFVVSRTGDLILALPVLLVAIVVAGIFDSGYWATVLLLIVLFCPSDIRIVRAGVLEQSALPYVEAARMLSLGGPRILFGQIVPNVLPIAFTNLLLNASIALVTLSSLSYLGLGVPAGTPDWGAQISDNQANVLQAPAEVLVPTALIVLVSCAMTVLGDHVNDRITNREGRV